MQQMKGIGNKPLTSQRQHLELPRGVVAKSVLSDAEDNYHSGIPLVDTFSLASKHGASVFIVTLLLIIYLF